MSPLSLRFKRPSITHVEAAGHNKLNVFLNLPTEIKDMIYSFIVYPYSDLVDIKTGFQPEHFGRTVLKQGIFRTCRQLRDDVLSWLLATKPLRILETQRACAFFICIGTSLQYLRKLHVIHVGCRRSLSTELVEKQAQKLKQEDKEFFAYLHKATSLGHLTICPDRFRVDSENSSLQEREELFLQQILDLIRSRPDLKFNWTVDTVRSKYNRNVQAEWRRVLGTQMEIVG